MAFCWRSSNALPSHELTAWQKGRTALMVVIEQGHTEIVEEMGTEMGTEVFSGLRVQLERRNQLRRKAMEKKRWVFMFSALCLAFAFSMSPVEAKEK